MILNEMITDYANLGTPNVLRGKEGRERPKSRLGRDPSRPATSLGKEPLVAFYSRKIILSGT